MSMTLEERIAQYKESEKANKELAKMCVTSLAKAENRYKAEECRQMIEWLSELQERRKQPEVIKCEKCKHFEIINYEDFVCNNPESKVYATDFEFGCILGERRTDD